VRFQVFPFSDSFPTSTMPVLTCSLFPSTRGNSGNRTDGVMVTRSRNRSGNSWEQLEQVGCGGCDEGRKVAPKPLSRDVQGLALLREAHGGDLHRLLAFSVTAPHPITGQEHFDFWPSLHGHVRTHVGYLAVLSVTSTWALGVRPGVPPTTQGHRS